MNKYYEVVGKIDGEIEVLFGSFDKEDCKYELDAERDSWKDEGYRAMKIRTRSTADTPDPEIYGAKALSKDEMVKLVKEYAYENYEKGWDTLVECHTDDEIREALGGAKTRLGAIRNVNKNLAISLYDEKRREIESTAW